MVTPQKKRSQNNPRHVEETTSGWVIILHPFLFALYPVLALLSENINEVPISDAYRSFLVVLAIAIITLGLMRLISRDWIKASLLTSLFLIVIFSYGHAYSLLKPVVVGGVMIGRHRFLIPFFGLVSAGGTWIILTRTRIPVSLTRYLNLVAAISIIIPTYAIVRYILQPEAEWNPESAVASTKETTLPPNATGPLPDIYYIIVDAYARADILLEQFNYDNSDFMDFLRDRGFYVADNSDANYLWTTLSLTSTLNMDYFSNLDINPSEGGYPYNLERLLQKSIVRNTLENLGYSTAGMMTGYRPTELRDAEYFLTPDLTTTDLIETMGGFNAFEGMLLRSTAGLILIDLDALSNTKAVQLLEDKLERPHQVQRLIILTTFDNLKQVPNIPSPKFVFVHILSPHRPYLFGPNGENTDNKEVFTLAENQPGYGEREDYRDQLIFITTKLEDTIDTILSRSEHPLVIILQADHGPWVGGMDWEDLSDEAIRGRAAILNAYYMDERCQTQLSPDITPVNTFRVIFNCYFGASYELLDNISYFHYAQGGNRFNFIPIEEILD